MSEDLDALLARLAREEEDDADRQRGEDLLAAGASQEKRRQEQDLAILELLRRAHAEHQADASSASSEASPAKE